MNFKPATIEGAFVITPPKSTDDRGFFLKAFDKAKFQEQGLISEIVQVNLSQNNKAGTIRGLHFQEGDGKEAKIMRCIDGSIFYAIVDMRKDSPTYLKWEGFTLSEENGLMVYVPPMCATGYQALTDNAKALYTSSNHYVPEAEKAVRWNDPMIKIAWPITENVSVSEKDASAPNTLP